jgi:hypothetical protein
VEAHLGGRIADEAEALVPHGGRDRLLADNELGLGTRRDEDHEDCAAHGTEYHTSAYRRGWNRDRSLWLFGDSFIATSAARKRSESRFVRWSRGFGGSTIAMRTAAAITGPFSAPRDLLKPPESTVERPFAYAAKAHPQLRTSDTKIALTFADNSFTFADLFDPAREQTLYWPHVVDLAILAVDARHGVPITSAAP